MDPTLVVAAGTGLVSAVAFLFRLLMTGNKERREEASVRSTEHALLCERVGTLEGEKRGIEMLSKKTLEVVHNAIESSRNPPTDQIT